MYTRGRYHRGNTNFATFCQNCSICGEATSKKYARAHDGHCKACETGKAPKSKHTCGCGNPLTAYQHAYGYHCDACTRQADPMGYAQELRGF